MEHVEGGPVKGPLPPDKAIPIAVQILDALDAAHRKGFVHRDLKPANILLTKTGVKLLDFGLAKQSQPIAPKPHEDTATQPITQQGEIAGTLQYMSPEQLQGEEADARSDLFAFGCVLYELLSGKRAFDGGSAASVIAAVIEREPAPLELQAPLGRVIKTCLAKDPAQRFQSALDLKRALLWAIDTPLATPKPPNRLKTYVLATLVLILGILAGWALGHRGPILVPTQAIRWSLYPPESTQFRPYSFAVSPDGRQVAFVAGADGDTRLWLRPFDGPARPLPGTEGAYYPFWSPHSRSIAFFANSKLNRIDIETGTLLTICEAGFGRGGSWGHDGQIVFATNNGGIQLVPESGGAPVEITRRDRNTNFLHHWPQILPGNKFIFWIRHVDPSKTGIYAATLGDSAKPPVLILPNETRGLFTAGHLLWLRGNTLVAQKFDPDSLKLTGDQQPIADQVGYVLDTGLMAVSASFDNVLLYSGSSFRNPLAWVNRANQPLGNISQPDNWNSFRISPDGRRVVASRDGTDLWLGEVDRNSWSRFTFRPGRTNFPTWSPDSRFVIFSQGSPRRLYRKEVAGQSGEQPLTGNSPAPQWANDWSRDGRQLLYYEIAPETQRDLWVMPITPTGEPDPSAKPRPYLKSTFNEFFGRFHPDPNPHWVAYQSDETGTSEVYIQSFPTPAIKRQISAGGGWFPQWSPNGRELFYVAANNKLTAVDIKLTPTAIDATNPRELFSLTWSNDASFGAPYDVAPDGQRILVRSPLRANPPLEVIHNWNVLLKRSLLGPP
jgi:Tol biopolymer transport system component